MEAAVQVKSLVNNTSVLPKGPPWSDVIGACAQIYRQYLHTYAYVLRSHELRWYESRPIHTYVHELYLTDDMIVIPCASFCSHYFQSSLVDLCKFPHQRILVDDYASDAA